MKRLNGQEVENEIKKLDGWTFLDISISKEFVFNDFKSAITFINDVAAVAEKLEHHPDILLHAWNKVKLYNSTHSAGGVTAKDLQLAEEIEKINIIY